MSTYANISIGSNIFSVLYTEVKKFVKAAVLFPTSNSFGLFEDEELYPDDKLSDFCGIPYLVPQKLITFSSEQTIV